jgi:hypothetical protein
MTEHGALARYNAEVTIGRDLLVGRTFQVLQLSKNGSQCKHLKNQDKISSPG